MIFDLDKEMDETRLFYCLVKILKNHGMATSHIARNEDGKANRITFKNDKCYGHIFTQDGKIVYIQAENVL